MNRAGSARAALAAVAVGALAVLGLQPVSAAAAPPQAFYVSTTGSDQNTGTSVDQAVQTLARAQQLVRDAAGGGPITVDVAAGTYHLANPLDFGPQDSGTPDAPVTWHAEPGATLVGGRALQTSWRPSSAPKILVADLPKGLDFDGLFVNGTRQILARYPNYDPNTAILGGFTTLADINARAASWADPTTADVRALHCRGWGGASFTVTGRNAGGLALQWVGDNNRRDACSGLPYDASHMMVENVREELDAPGEWFYDKAAGQLYYYPPDGTGPATVETAELDQLVHVEGDSVDAPAHDIVFDGFRLTGTHRTLFDTPYEGIQLGDWAVARTGAVYLKDAKNITISGSFFDQLGGNGVFMDGYNAGNVVSGNHFDQDGASDVSTVGSTDAVRDPSTWSHKVTSLDDKTPGPKTEDYPRDITISDNLMENMGRFEKETAGVNLSMSAHVTVDGNTIHGSPRSCININDGTWSGHLIENNDLFGCVLETTDHGPINAWGRDRYWTETADDATKKADAFLDAMDPIIIKHNRIWYDNNRNIDLDNGATNYVIEDNLLLNAGIKLREGFNRIVRNNILVNGQIYEQATFADDGDDIEHNIVLNAKPYEPFQSDPATAKYTIDNNLFWNNGQPVNGIDDAWHGQGMDVHSVVADPKFVGGSPWQNPAMTDYTVAGDSPALDIGFQNLPMTGFGVGGDAPTPPPVQFVQTGTGIQDQPEQLMGATATGIYSDDIQFAAGLTDRNGLYLQDVPAGSYAAAHGLRTADVIRAVNGQTVTDRTTFWFVYNAIAAGAPLHLSVWRDHAATDVGLAKTDQPEQLNDTSGVVYAGDSWDWKNSARGGSKSYLDDLWATTELGDSFSLTFNGTGLDIITETFSNEGDIDLYLDGDFYQTISCVTPDRVFQNTVASISGLSPGVHTIEGVMKTGAHLIVDAFVTHPAPATSPLRATGEQDVLAANPATDLSLATFSGGTPDYTASVDWGDGSAATAGVIARRLDGTFTVAGSHDYQTLGPKTVTVAVHDAGGATAEATSMLLAYGTSDGGTFVLGDGNAAPGSRGQFWGAQWWRANSLSGGPAPADYAGFADGPASCGSTWTARPGGSSHPPATLPAYLAVAVTGEVSADRSATTTHVVIVKTDAGYRNDLGHRGTGAVVAVAC